MPAFKIYSFLAASGRIPKYHSANRSNLNSVVYYSSKLRWLDQYSRRSTLQYKLPRFVLLFDITSTLLTKTRQPSFFRSVSTSNQPNLMHSKTIHKQSQPHGVLTKFNTKQNSQSGTPNHLSRAETDPKRCGTHFSSTNFSKFWHKFWKLGKKGARKLQCRFNNLMLWQNNRGGGGTTVGQNHRWPRSKETCSTGSRTNLSWQQVGGFIVY